MTTADRAATVRVFGAWAVAQAPTCQHRDCWAAFAGPDLVAAADEMDALLAHFDAEHDPDEVEPQACCQAVGRVIS